MPTIVTTVIAAAKRKSFIMAVDAARDRLDNDIQFIERFQGSHSIKLSSGTKTWEIFSRIVKAAIWAAKSSGVAIFDQQLQNAPTKNGPYQNIGI